MEQLIKKIEEEKLIVILRGIKKEHLLDLTNAMYEGGVRLLEITYSANGSVWLQHLKKFLLLTGFVPTS